MTVVKKKAAKKKAVVKKEIKTVSAWHQYHLDGVKFSELSDHQKLVLYKRDASFTPQERNAVYQLLQAEGILPKFEEWLTS